MPVDSVEEAIYHGVMSHDAEIETLNRFRDSIQDYRNTGKTDNRRWIVQNCGNVRRLLVEANCFKTYTIGPPPAIGGLVMQNVDLFDYIFDPPYLMDVANVIMDMIDAAIGVYADPGFTPRPKRQSASISVQNIQKGYVFIAMPMAKGRPEYDDVHDAIKESCLRCGLTAERIDEIETNERITDKLLESINKAEFVVCNLTDSKPNVFYESGYAHGIGKIPIYIAKSGTKLEFDLKDYPIILFNSMRELKDGLERRLRKIATK